MFCYLVLTILSFNVTWLNCIFIPHTCLGPCSPHLTCFAIVKICFHLLRLLLIFSVIMAGMLCWTTDLKHDYILTEDFVKNHFLVGLLLTEVKSALNEIQDIRKFAITTLRNLLAKHSVDDRYSSKVFIITVNYLLITLFTTTFALCNFFIIPFFHDGRTQKMWDVSQ